MDVIQHDVRRLDRLISDISDASRLDAELARSDARTLDLEVLLRDMIDISRQVGHSKKAVEIEYVVDRKPANKAKFTVEGHDLRIGQIVTNLIENARSFVPNDTGKITVRLTRTRTRCVIYIEDNGPGIQAEDIDRIFERFTPTGRNPKGSGRIPASVSPSAARSPKRMADRCGPKTSSRATARR